MLVDDAAYKKNDCDCIEPADSPENHFDGVFANVALFHVPSQELPRVLLKLHATLKPSGVLFTSNPHDHNDGLEPKTLRRVPRS